MVNSKVISVYLAVQGVLVGLWWLMLVVAPASRSQFMVPGAHDLTILTFWLADLSLVGAGSLWAAHHLWRRVKGRRAVLWFVAGAISYAALTCLGLTLLTGQAWLATLLMVPAATLTAGAAWTDGRI